MMDDLITAIILSGINTFKKGRYPSNVNSGGFPSARIESLTFLHSEYFRVLCEVVGIDSNELLIKNQVPPKGDDCPCEECKTNYEIECKLMGKEQAFENGQKQYVVWKADKIVHMQPQ